MATARTQSTKSDDYYVYSTLSNDQQYTLWKEGTNGPNVPLHSVLIKGKANVVDTLHLITPKGVVTAVSKDDMEFLSKDPGFNQHKENGFILVEQKKADANRVAQDMTPKDSSAPHTLQDYESRPDLPDPKLNLKNAQ